MRDCFFDAVTVSSPSTIKFGLMVNRGYEEVRVEGIRKLRTADNNPLQGLEGILGYFFLQRRIVHPSPVDPDVDVSHLSVVELKSVPFEQAVSGPLLGIVEADVNLSDKSIRK